MSAKIWILGVGLVLAGTGYALREPIAAAFSGDEEQAIEGALVRRGPLRINVIERGNLKAADSVTLQSDVEGQTTILFLIEEGEHVEVGELLCELDTSDLIERRVQQEIAVQNTEAAYIKAKQNYEIQTSQNTSEIARAERELEFARLDLAKYVEGDWPQERQRADEEILLADEELTRAQQEMEWSERLAERGFLENTQLEADRLARTRAEIALNQKRRAKELLEQYEFPRQKSELDADVEEKGRELERVRLQASAKIVDFDAETRTSKARHDLETEKLRKLDSQIEKARMHAPVAGMVVYYQEPGRRWGGGEPLREGSQVREREQIITIPSTESMIAEASLHESVLDRVKESMPCVVTVDAIPERGFPGEVKYKAVLPDQNSWWANPDLRVYRTEVRMIESDERLRPGMSCSIEIVVDELDDVLYIPLQSVFVDQGSTVAFVAGGGATEKRSIRVGQNNGTWAVVEEGLREGETVFLSPPPGFELQAAPLGGAPGEPDPSMRGGQPSGMPGSAGVSREGKPGEGKPGAGKPGAGEAGGGQGRDGRAAGTPGGEGARPAGAKPGGGQADGRPAEKGSEERPAVGGAAGQGGEERPAVEGAAGQAVEERPAVGAAGARTPSEG